MSANHADRTTELHGAGLAAATDRRNQLEPGTVLNARYRIEKELGRGGIGVVYLAHDQRLHNSPVVVKLLLERLGDDEERSWFEKKFKDEIRALAQIDHPGVVRALDVGELADGRSYLVMQYVSGVDLRSLMRPARMDLKRVAPLIRQIGHALSAAHQRGVLHRDLKPENIMMQTVNSEEFVKLIDFGMATVLEAPGTVKTTVVAGTVQYMAPEQMQGKPCTQSDIFAMGVIGYEMVTGRLPFNPRTLYELLELQRAGVRRQPRELRPELSEAAQAVILRALAFDPAKRYQSAADFGDGLADALTQEALTQEAQHQSGRAWQSHRSGVQLAYVLLAEVDGYSRMSLEEQTRSLEELQTVVRQTQEFQQAYATNELISQTATRGMALVFFGADPLVAVRCAVEIADSLRTSDQLKVRMGMHTGPIKVTPDINDRPNVSGDGMDTAHRVMSCGDAGQILLSRTVADVLRHLSEWSPHLKDLGERRIDGGERVRVFSLATGEVAAPNSKALGPIASRLAWLSGAKFAAVAGMLVVAVLGWFVWGQVSSPPRLNSGGDSSIPGGPYRSLRYTIVAQKDPRRYPDSKPATAPDGMIFEAGDKVRLNVNITQDGHLYIVNEGPVQPSGMPQLIVLFPRKANNGGSAAVKSNQPIQIPASRRRPDQAWLEFDNEDGTEWLWLVWSEHGVAELEAVTARANPRDVGAISDLADIKSITEYLAAHSPVDPEIKKDELTKETTVSAHADVVVGLVKLEHRRKKL